MFHFAMSTISMSVCITLTIAVLAHATLNSGTPVSQPCLIYSGTVAAASSATVMGLVLVAGLSITQTLMLTMAFAVVFALVWEYAGFDACLASTHWVSRTGGASEQCERVGMVRTATWAPATIGDLASDRSGPDDESDVKALFDCARSLAIGPGEFELLTRAGREGADLDEVDGALRMLMKLLIHPSSVRDPVLLRNLVDYQRRLHTRHAVLSVRTLGQSGDIGRSAVEAQVQARLARLNSSLGREYSDD